MERIAHRDLRNSSAEILRRVAAGESFEVTNHGEVVAVLSPPGTVLMRVKLATEHGGWADLPRYPVKESVQAMLDDLRQDIV